MMRRDLIERLALDNPELSKGDAERIVMTIFNEIVRALAQGRRVELRGFGVFATKVMPPGSGVIPQTGEERHWPGRTLPKFRAGKQMLARLNQVR